MIKFGYTKMCMPLPTPLRIFRLDRMYVLDLYHEMQQTTKLWNKWGANVLVLRDQTCNSITSCSSWRELKSSTRAEVQHERQYYIIIFGPFVNNYTID